MSCPNDVNVNVNNNNHNNHTNNNDNNNDNNHNNNTNDIPIKLTRYRHPSHCHKLFLTFTRDTNIFCDNLNCKRRLHNNEVSFACFRCNFDLCAHCIRQPTSPSCVCDLSLSDQEVNEDVLFLPERHIKKPHSVTVCAGRVNHENGDDDDDDNNDDGDGDDNDGNDDNNDNNNNGNDGDDNNNDNTNPNNNNGNDGDDNNNDSNDGDDNNNNTNNPNTNNSNTSNNNNNTNTNNDDNDNINTNNNDDNDDSDEEAITLINEINNDNNYDELIFIPPSNPALTISNHQERKNVIGNNEELNSLLQNEIPIATVTFSSENYDGLTTRLVNDLLGSVGPLDMMAMPIVRNAPIIIPTSAAFAASTTTSSTTTSSTISSSIPTSSTASSIPSSSTASSAISSVPLNFSNQRRLTVRRRRINNQ